MRWCFSASTATSTPTTFGACSPPTGLLGPDNAQGLVPGEGAVAVRLGRRGQGGAGAVTLHGVATTREPDRVDGERWSQGRALLAAFAGAAGEDGSAEPHVDFVISTTNGERYVQWEAVLARTRFFRTRRAHLPVVCPAMSVGDIGAAAAPLMLMLAWDAFTRRHAPGAVAMLEATSEGGLRSAAILRGPKAA
jgi:3-oxoacyl-[acyl-carrier-protein] synthase I